MQDQSAFQDEEFLHFGNSLRGITLYIISREGH